jgi:PAS domain S-box-containing protein
MAGDSGNLAEQNQLLNTEIQRRVDQLAAINRVASAMGQSLDLQTTLDAALDAVLEVTPIEAAGISLIDENAGELVLQAQRGWKHDFVSEPVRIPLDRGISGQALARDQVIITGDVSEDPRLAVPEFADEGFQAMALVPMHARGRVVGLLSVMSYEPYDFDEDEIAVLGNIADQVGMALDNARLYQDAKEQSSRLRAVLDSSGDAIIATDCRGHISLVNTAAEALFDLQNGDIIGMPLRHAPLHPRLREGLRNALASDQDSNTVYEVTLEDGRFLSVIVSPVFLGSPSSAAQDSKGWVIVIRDVTYLREAEQTRIDFIHAAAHDLRNPLGVTLGALAMLQRDLGEVSDLQREVIEIGIQGVNRMQELIDNVLNLEHIESGVGLQDKEIDVRELLERGIIDIQPALQQREQMLVVAVPDELPPLLGDMHWLYRALLNLLTNANKYTPVGGEITLGAYVQGDDLFIEVSDNGPGIPPEYRTHIFERFYRAPASDQRARGSGLGLAIVKSVVEQHGGRVFVQSQEDVGSTFGMIFSLSDMATRAGAAGLDVDSD